MLIAYARSPQHEKNTEMAQQALASSYCQDLSQTKYLPASTIGARQA